MLIYASSPSFSAYASTPTDASSAIQFNLSSSSSMALTIIIFIVILFFIGFFSVFARRFFSGIQNPHLIHYHRRPPPALLSHRHYHLSSSLNIYGTLGLDPATIRALPVLLYVGGGSPSGCVVCLGEFEERDRVKLIPGCGHVFHPDCIDGWLLLCGSCPVCRCTEVLGAGVGDFWVHLGDGAQEERDGLPRALGRSRSFDGRKGESFMQLQRSCSM